MESEASPDNGIAAEFTPLEERWNAAIHALGALLAIAGLIVLLVRADTIGQSGSLPVSAVYGAALVLLYVFSATHHAISHPSTKQVFLALDHCGIYLLIAGTYTPFFLIMPAGEGWLLIAFVWGVAGLGIAFQMGSFLAGRSDDYERFAFVLYLALGWIPLLWVGDDLLGTLHSAGFVLLAAGGIAYTGGVIFYLWRSLSHHHAIWHGFVVAGSALQFFSIFQYVVPATV